MTGRNSRFCFCFGSTALLGRRFRFGWHAEGYPGVCQEGRKALLRWRFKGFYSETYHGCDS